LDYHAFLSNYKGGQIVLLNAQRKVIDCYEVRVSSLSPDQKRFVFIGRPGVLTPKDEGTYVACLHAPGISKVWGTISPGKHVHERTYPVPTRKSLDRLPGSIARGWRGRCTDAHTGKARKIGDGGGARWSPSSNLITYVTPKVQAVLLNVTTGQTRLIDPGRALLAPVEWSPDGRYLLSQKDRGAM
jgi:hypothetical protein